MGRPKKAAAVLDRPAPQTANVYITMMTLQKLIAVRVPDVHWGTVAALRPLRQDDEASPFNVFFRVPGTVSEFLGQYPPDTDAATLAQIADEVIAAHKAAAAVAVPLTQTVDDDGQVVSVPFEAGKTVKHVTIDKYTGQPTVSEIAVRPHVVKESEQEEVERLRRELAAAPKVMIDIDTVSDADEHGPYEVIAWNGIIEKLRPGMQEVPKPLADQWVSMKKAYNGEGMYYKLGLENGKVYHGGRANVDSELTPAGTWNDWRSETHGVQQPER